MYILANITVRKCHFLKAFRVEKSHDYKFEHLAQPSDPLFFSGNLRLFLYSGYQNSVIKLELLVSAQNRLIFDFSQLLALHYYIHVPFKNATDFPLVKLFKTS